MDRDESGEAAALLSVVDQCLDILQDHNRSRSQDLAAGPLPSLLGQCLALVADHGAVGSRPIRSIHHFACTGGTLFSRCVAAMPNVCMFSELDPLSTRELDPRKPSFAPTDVIRHLYYQSRPLPEAIYADTYKRAMSEVHGQLADVGLQLVIRDHPHSHYCIGDVVPERASHLSILREIADVQSVVTVRNPVESYLSLLSHKWVSFEPTNFDEYCRRYLLFLDQHAGLEIFKYEDLVTETDRTLERLCSALSLEFVPGAGQLISAIRLTGDSGRGGHRISPLSTRPRPDAVKQEIAASAHYSDLKVRLDY